MQRLRLAREVGAEVDQMPIISPITTRRELICAGIALRVVLPTAYLPRESVVFPIVVAELLGIAQLPVPRPLVIHLVRDRIVPVMAKFADHFVVQGWRPVWEDRRAVLLHKFASQPVVMRDLPASIEVVRCVMESSADRPVAPKM